MNSNSVIATVAFALAFGAAAGCSSTDANNLKQDVGNLAEHSKESLSNVGMVARVNGTLTQVKGVDVSGLHIEAQNGVVTVSGHVKDAQAKQRVLETVKNIKGVDSVVDKLRVQA